MCYFHWVLEIAFSSLKHAITTRIILCLVFNTMVKLKYKLWLALNHTLFSLACCGTFLRMLLSPLRFRRSHIVTFCDWHLFFVSHCDEWVVAGENVLARGGFLLTLSWLYLRVSSVTINSGKIQFLYTYRIRSNTKQKSLVVPTFKLWSEFCSVLSGRCILWPDCYFSSWFDFSSYSG